MKKYQYQILRYVHDQFSGEFLNIGVIVYAPESLFLKAMVCQKYKRINDFFPKANGRFIIKMANQFELGIQKISNQLAEIFQPDDHLSTVTRSILPLDDSALMLTEVKSAIDVDMDSALNYLYSNMVEKFNTNTQDHQSLNDNEVWRNKYKVYFDKYNITMNLTEHTVHTKYSEFVFDKSWKNEIWHCYQPLSFELQDADSIHEKVHKWSGRLKDLDSSKEKMHLTFLSSLSDKHLKLKEFILDFLDQDTDNISVDVVLDSDAEKLAQSIRKNMNEHENNAKW